MTWTELISELRESIGLKTGPVGARKLKRGGFQYGPPGLQDIEPGPHEAVVNVAKEKARAAKELRRKKKAASQYGPPALQGIGPKVQFLASPRPY